MTDTIELLRECDAGVKMGVSAIDKVLDKVVDSKLRKLLTSSREHHQQLGDRLHAILLDLGSDDKEPNPMAKGMSWMKTNVMMNLEESDATIADLITDGCNMGVKSLHKYLNQYQRAEQTAKHICKELIQIEEELVKGLRPFL